MSHTFKKTRKKISKRYSKAATRGSSATTRRPPCGGSGATKRRSSRPGSRSVSSVTKRISSAEGSSATTRRSSRSVSRSGSKETVRRSPAEGSNATTRRSSRPGSRSVSRATTRISSRPGPKQTDDDYNKKKENLNVLLTDIPRVWKDQSYSIELKEDEIETFIKTGELNSENKEKRGMFQKLFKKHVMFHPEYGIFKIIWERWHQDIYYKQFESSIYKILSDYLFSDTVRRGTVKRVTKRRGILNRVTKGMGIVRRGTARRGTVRRGTEGRGTVRRGTEMLVDAHKEKIKCRGKIIKNCFNRISNAINMHSESGYIKKKINEEMSNFINENDIPSGDHDALHTRIKQIPERIIVSLCSNILPTTEIVKLIDTICRVDIQTNTHFIDNLINFCCNVTKLYLTSQKNKDLPLGESLETTWMDINDKVIEDNFKNYLKKKNPKKYINNYIESFKNISPLHKDLNNYSNREEILIHVANILEESERKKLEELERKKLEELER